MMTDSPAAEYSMADLFMRTMKEECDTPVEGEIVGNIPSWISGTVLRNGPGLFEFGGQKYNHLFEGMSAIHRFHLDKGKVTYSIKFLKSDRYNKNTEAQRIVMAEFATLAMPDPCQTMWQKFMSRFAPRPIGGTDNCNVTICTYGDQVYAATESPNLWKIDPETLNTVAKVDLSSYLAINHATAHVHNEKDGTVYNVGNSFHKGPHYNIVKFPPPPAVTTTETEKGEHEEIEALFKQASVLASIPSRWRLHPAYYHSFAISENYVIFIEQPLCISVPGMMTTNLRKTPLSQNIVWYGDNYKNQFYIINKATGEIHAQRYQSSASFSFFHCINAFEDNDNLVLDVCAFADGGLITRFYREHLEQITSNELEREKLWAVPWRFVLPLKPSKDVGVGKSLVSVPYSKCTATWDKNDFITCTHEEIPKATCELPRINYGLNGKKYRYFYAVSVGDLIKVDWHTHQVTTWSDEDCYATEPIFVADPDSRDEDHGVILSAVLKRSDPTKTELLILDARSFTELGRAKFSTPSAVPFTFHGMFLKEGDKLHAM